MTIGNKIFELRNKKNLSQAELAELLEVSRQSISKWETDASIPDLDKLIKLSEVFNISIDELVGREKASNLNAEPHPKVCMLTHQNIIGYILLSISLIAGTVIWIFAESENELIMPLSIIFSLLACALICLFVKQNAAYWCIWAILAPIVIIYPYIIGCSIIGGTIGPLVFIATAMFFVANKLFEKTKCKVSIKRSVFITVGWVALIALISVPYIIVYSTVIDTTTAYIPVWGIHLITYVGTALLTTHTVCYLKNLRKSTRK